MLSLRTQETSQKEYDLQAVETVQINLNLQAEFDPTTLRGKLTDYATFANVLRGAIFDQTLIVLQRRPEIKLSAFGEGYEVDLYINGNCWRFHVNGSTSYQLSGDEKLLPSRALKKLWDLVIPKLPENFIVRGVINKETPGFEERSEMLQGLGLSETQENSEVYGIIKSKTLVPISLGEVLSLTTKTPGELDQKLDAKKIVWPGV